MELVTLESPDGRRHRTDSASEINLLVGSYGYHRVEEQTSRSQRNKPAASKPQATPSSSPETPASSEASSS